MYPKQKEEGFEDDSPDLLSEDDFPEEPTTWDVDDFEDILDLFDEEFPE